MHAERRPTATGYWLLATGYWLLATGYWLLATGCFLRNGEQALDERGLFVLEDGAQVEDEAIALDAGNDRRVEAALRRLEPPIVARIERDRLVLDLRTVFEEEDASLVAGLRTVA